VTTPSSENRAGEAGRFPEYLLIALVSASVLAYEFLLSRLLTIRYWSYFAAMIVSLAMLGFAASGTLLFIMGRRSDRETRALHGWLLPVFALAIPLCFRVSGLIKCQPLAVLWDPAQLALFAGNYLVLAVPFFLGGWLIGHYFVRSELPTAKIYFANMTGAAAGVVVALLLLGTFPLSRILHFVPLPLLLLAVWRDRRSPRRLVSIVAAVVVLGLGISSTTLPEMSEYKELKRAVLLPDAVVEKQFSSLFGEMCVVDSRYFRYAPGLSLNFTGDIPRQKTVFSDGDAVSTACRWRGGEDLKGFTSAMLGSLPYRLIRRPRVLLIGADAMQTLTAVIHGASQVDVIEANPNVPLLLKEHLRDFSGNLYGHADVRTVGANARLFARQTTSRYDLVVLPVASPPFASAVGTSSQDPDYVFTRESFSDFFSLLNPGGVLVVHTWLNVPPREEIKAFATAFEALRDSGVRSPAGHLCLVRAIRNALLMVFRRPVTADQTAQLQACCNARAFDRVFYPGITPGEANLFNRIDGAPHFVMATGIASGKTDVYERHVYNIVPCSDDRPYFSHFFRWASFRQLLAKTGRNVAVQVGWGYMFLLISMVQAVPLGILVVLLPLILSGRRSGVPRIFRWRTHTYFFAIGLGYMLVEMAAIHQAARFTRHPVVAFALVLCVMLAGSGLGSLASGRAWMSRRLTFTALLGLILLHVAVWRAALHDGSFAWFGAAVLTLLVLSFFMGVPFPRGMAALRDSGSGLVPWAWGINGFASVVSVLLAGLLALALGHRALYALAAVSYVTAGITDPTRKRRSSCTSRSRALGVSLSP